jgi:hypothetical protein
MKNDDSFAYMNYMNHSYTTASLFKGVPWKSR